LNKGLATVDEKVEIALKSIKGIRESTRRSVSRSADTTLPKSKLQDFKKSFVKKLKENALFTKHVLSL